MKLPVKLKRMFSPEIQDAMELYAQWILKKSAEPAKSAYKRLEEKIREIGESTKRTDEKLGRLGIYVNDKFKEHYRSKSSEAIKMHGKSHRLIQLAIEIIPSVLADQWDMKIRRCQPETFFVVENRIDFDLVVHCLSYDEFPVAFFCEVKSNLTENIVKNHLQKVRVVTGKLGGEMQVIFFAISASPTAQKLIQQSGGLIIFANGNLQQFPGNN